MSECDPHQRAFTFETWLEPMIFAPSLAHLDKGYLTPGMRLSRSSPHPATEDPAPAVERVDCVCRYASKHEGEEHMSTGRMRLHHFSQSSASYRVRTALALKGVAIDYIGVDMPTLQQQGPAYAALNPQRMVPCLELPDGRVLAQSLAIIDYLEHLYPDPPIYPSDPLDKAQALAIVLFIACETSPFQATIIRRVLQDEFGFDAARDRRWVTKWIRRGLEHIETFLASRPQQTPFAVGDVPGIVDIFAIPQLRNADLFGIATGDLIHLRNLYARCQKHPAFAAAHPDAWADRSASSGL